MDWIWIIITKFEDKNAVKVQSRYIISLARAKEDWRKKAKHPGASVPSPDRLRLHRRCLQHVERVQYWPWKVGRSGQHRSVLHGARLRRVLRNEVYEETCFGQESPRELRNWLEEQEGASTKARQLSEGINSSIIRQSKRRRIEVQRRPDE